MREFNYDTINRYLDELMTEEEARAFKDQMLKDIGLREEVELVKEVNRTLKIKLHPDENELALRNSLKSVSSELSHTNTRPAQVIPLKRRRWMLAAAAVLIVAVVLTVWQPWEKSSLYTQYAAIQMPGTAERGAATDSLLRSAADKFNNNKFAEAIPFFEARLKNDPQNSFVQYYHAIALLQNGETGRSRAGFSQLYNGASLFRYDAAFYLALSYLKEKDKDNCRLWLKKIPADAGVYEKAQELLKKL